MAGKFIRRVPKKQPIAKRGTTHDSQIKVMMARYSKGELEYKCWKAGFGNCKSKSKRWMASVLITKAHGGSWG